MAEKNNAVIYGEIVAKCWDDEDFKKKFVADPETVLTDAGFKLEEGVTYKVINAPRNVRYVVIPHEGAKEVVQKISAALLNRVESGEAIVPEGVEVRIVQNTDDTRNLILPASPKTLTASELKAISGGDAGTVLPTVQLVASSVAEITNEESAAVCPFVTMSTGQEVINATAVVLI